MTGAPAAVVAAIALQFVWIGIRIATNWDPYPFVFLLTLLYRHPADPDLRHRCRAAATLAA
jgi:hypothetical protein